MGGVGGGEEEFENPQAFRDCKESFNCAKAKRTSISGANFSQKGYYTQKLCRQSCRELLWLCGVAGVAQLVRAWVLCAQGRGFEPPHPHFFLWTDFQFKLFCIISKKGIFFVCSIFDSFESPNASPGDPSTLLSIVLFLNHFSLKCFKSVDFVIKQSLS